VRAKNGRSEVHLGDPAEPQEDWSHLGAVPESVVRAILESTRSGLNEMTIQAQTYRFVRLFSQVGDVGAVIFVVA